MFVSTYSSAVDAKGRVSVPAPFRSALGGASRIFLWPALDGSGCLEGGGEALMATYTNMLRRLPPASKARKALANGLFARAADLKMDENGRIKLPDALREAADLRGKAVFAGNIDSFQVWNPEAHAAYDAAMAEHANDEDVLGHLEQSYRDVVAAGAVPLLPRDGGT